ncbi:cyanobactin biosynthesis PatC/TenC/TruC family protein [Phormidium sp. FACHB-1136]|uniref:cyanobactin biosynthesis PatC/TenC/TruC family protein n=1 Tax=Phormidium sp. FACHB-1136 TaxID=2692848 RepID=UPI001F54A32C|nr:cyanobactin biosynthesis PatC/TenC/TruC family protein [Phormidium sp. FACHB-1136]
MAPSLPLVDLVILTDTSPTLKADARAISEAAESALAIAQGQWPLDIRLVWLGIEGRWRQTAFTQTLRTYLTQECQVDPGLLRSRQRGELPDGGAQEDAARAIEDATTHLDWRSQAQRHLLYLGDEALEAGGEKPEAADVAAADRAIQAAQTAGVRVHTHLGLSKSRHRDALAQEYARVATATGGLAFAASAAAPTDFVAALVAILGHHHTALSTDSHKETAMATKDTPAPADTTPQKSYLPTTQTGLQDYAYWWEYARKQAKKGKGVKDFRRGRIWT